MPQIGLFIPSSILNCRSTDGQEIALQLDALRAAALDVRSDTNGFIRVLSCQRPL